MRRFCMKYGMLVLIALSLAAAGGVFTYSMFYETRYVEVDCRGSQIDVEVMRSWQEQEKNGYLGLVNMAGWRVENQGDATSVSTGRSKRTRVVGVYGPMEMVYSAKIISGNYGLTAEDGYCVLSESLAYELFGNTDAVGEQVRFDGRVLTVAGVIDKKDDYLLIPVSEGVMEHLALQFRNGFQVKDKVKELLAGICIQRLVKS